MQEPSELNVGQLIELKCGHTARPSDLETVMFTVHLQEAGFMAGTGNIGSPTRSVNLNSSSPSIHGEVDGDEPERLQERGRS